ncbi:MAG: protein kinase domain-containing protein, partial [Fimbriiglobus sp.]
RGKVLDFGFALRVGEPAPDDPTILGGQGYTVGTMDYLPPEQAAAAAAVGPPADVYALGCSLYFALTGEPPFPGGGPQDKIRWHRTAFPPPMTDLNPLLPAELDRLVGWFMAKKPADRPTADRAAQELAAWADPIRPAMPGAIPSDADWVRTVEERWLSTRAAQPAPEDDGPVAIDTSASGVMDRLPPDVADEEVPGEPPAVTRPKVRLPVRARVLLAAAAAVVVMFFVLGVLVGYWAGRQ